jgi:hypothetical protein
MWEQIFDGEEIPSKAKKAACGLSQSYHDQTVGKIK